MSNFDTITNVRKSRKKKRVVLMFTEETVGELIALHQGNPDASASQVAADAIRFALGKNMYNTTKTTNTTDMRGAWCVQYGGTTDGLNCTFEKYEVTPSGEVVKSERTLPLKSMPELQVDFRKMVLGPFQSLAEARLAAVPDGHDREGGRGKKFQKN